MLMAATGSTTTNYNWCAMHGSRVPVVIPERLGPRCKACGRAAAITGMALGGWPIARCPVCKRSWTVGFVPVYVKRGPYIPHKYDPQRKEWVPNV